MAWSRGNPNAKTGASTNWWRLAGLVALIVLVGLAGGLVAVAAGSPAAATRPTITKLVDADNNGTFNDSETVPATATYPWTVTYRLTIDAGTYSHLIKTISDPMGGALTSATKSPSCSSLVGTTIAAGSSTVCYYNVTFHQASSAPLVNTVTIHWDSAGQDTTSASATVNFPPPTPTRLTTPTPTTPTPTTPTSTPPPTTPAPPATTTAPVPPLSVDLSITKTAVPSRVAVGGVVAFDEHVTNNGPGDAHAVTVTDALPAGLTFASVSTTQGACRGGPVITCLIGTVAAGADVTITVHTRASQPGTHVNQATVTSTDPESDLANNTAQAAVKAAGPVLPPTTSPPAKKQPPKTTTTTATPKYTG